ncbi:MAG: hypothetical protein M1831_003428 [Alyxoria varia]|nr:MAG: hypothetical protein M1831_003428 [Alyxoria varia]
MRHSKESSDHVSNHRQDAADSTSTSTTTNKSTREEGTLTPITSTTSNRPILHHLNADSSWLIQLPLPRSLALPSTSLTSVHRAQKRSTRQQTDRSIPQKPTRNKTGKSIQQEQHCQQCTQKQQQQQQQQQQQHHNLPKDRKPEKRYFNILVDPWLSGSQSDIAGWFSTQWHADESTFASINAVEGLIARSEREISRSEEVAEDVEGVVDDNVAARARALSEQRSSYESEISPEGPEDPEKEGEEQEEEGQERRNRTPIDAIIVSHEFTDHCHKQTLLEVDPSVPVFAADKAADIIQGWRHFEKVVKIPAFGGASGDDGGVVNGASDRNGDARHRKKRRRQNGDSAGQLEGVKNGISSGEEQDTGRVEGSAEQESEEEENNQESTPDTRRVSSHPPFLPNWLSITRIQNPADALYYHSAVVISFDLNPHTSVKSPSDRPAHEQETNKSGKALPRKRKRREPQRERQNQREQTHPAPTAEAIIYTPHGIHAPALKFLTDPQRIRGPQLEILALLHGLHDVELATNVFPFGFSFNPRSWLGHLPNPFSSSRSSRSNNADLADPLSRQDPHASAKLSSELDSSPPSKQNSHPPKKKREGGGYQMQQLNLGAHNGLALQRTLRAKYWIGTHDEVKRARGVVGQWLLRRKVLDVAEAVAEAAREGVREGVEEVVEVAKDGAKKVVGMDVDGGGDNEEGKKVWELGDGARYLELGNGESVALVWCYAVSGEPKEEAKSGYRF